MGVFEHFPYTNFHDLNLDKILERTQEAEEAVETSAQQAETAAEAAAQAVTDAQQAVANKVIPMLFVDIDFSAASGDRLHWYDGSVNGSEITSRADLLTYLSTGSDGVTNARTSVMTRLNIANYEAGYVIQALNASIEIVRRQTLIYYRIICIVEKPTDSTIHQLIFKINPNDSFNDFTLTDISI